MALRLRLLQDCSPSQLFELETSSFTSDRISLRSFRRLLRRPSVAGHGVYEGSRLVGYSLVFFRVNSSKARIYSLAVAADQRGKGIGRMLVEGAVRLARERGSNQVQLEVAGANKSAIGLYESLGFHAVGSRPHYYEDGADALVYQLNIDPYNS